MKVKLDVSPDTEIKVESDEEGNVLSIEFEPIFARKKGNAVLAYGIATNDHGVLLDRFYLIASGTTGKITKAGRSEPVKAAVDEITSKAKIKTVVEDTPDADDEEVEGRPPSKG